MITAIAGATTALMAATVATTALTGIPTATAASVLSNDAARRGGAVAPAADCEALLASYVSRGQQWVGPYGWDNLRYAVPMPADAGAASPSSPTSKASAEASAPQAATSTTTGTNVQEAGVDEPDLVKTDGRFVYRVKDNVLTTWEIVKGQARERSRIGLGGVRNAELLLTGDRLFALGANRSLTPSGSSGSSGTRMVVLDRTDPGSPAVLREAFYNADLDAARLTGTQLRLVLSSSLPVLDFVVPDGDTGVLTATEKNKAVVAASKLTDWLPSVTWSDGGTTPLLTDCTAGLVPSAADSIDDLGSTTIVGFSADTPQVTSVTALATSTDTSYFSTDRLYLASAPTWSWRGCCVAVDTPPIRRESAASGGTSGWTDLHSFVLGGGVAATSPVTAYAASGALPGLIRNRWSLDSAGGVLRVAVEANEATGNYSSIVTMREEAGRLVQWGRLNRLGVGEQLKSVRWFDDLAYLVTFRQIDPLYAIDLSSPGTPKLRGKLKIPGFSEYLHPLGSMRLIGIGQDVRDNMAVGAQAALFDVHKMSRPRRLSVAAGPEHSYAAAANDPRQFTWLRKQRVALTVLSNYTYNSSAAWVQVLRPRGGELQSRLIKIPGGRMEQVRTVPLPSGKVVLVTASGAEVLKLS